MKTCINRYAWFALASMIAIQSVRAEEDRARRFFVHADLGPAMVEETNLREFLGPVRGADVEFDTGIRFDVAGGFQATDWFAVELQSGFTAHYIDRFKGLGRVSPHHSSFTTVPLMVNAVFQYPTQIGLVPFAGGGAGGSVGVLYADDISGRDSGGNRFILDGSDSDVVFAYQGFAGLRYRLTENMELGLVYKYLHADGPSWDVDTFFEPEVGDITFDSVAVHSINFLISLRF